MALFLSSIDAKSRAAYACALPAEAGALLQQWVYLLLLFPHFISAQFPHASHRRSEEVRMHVMSLG